MTDLPSWNAELDCSLLTRLRLVTHFLCQQTDLEFSLQQKYFTSIYFISAKSFGNEKCWIKLIQRERRASHQTYFVRSEALDSGPPVKSVLPRNGSK